MNNSTELHKDAVKMLEETSRTFFIPIRQLSPGLREAVTSAYLCMRAIDEIEDHPLLPSHLKVDLLLSIRSILQKPFQASDLTTLLLPYTSILPEVTLRLADWINISPKEVIPNICDATATMAEGMAEWVSKGWDIRSEEDLDQYTFYVAGLVGILLSDLWMWYEEVETDRKLAVSFGRGLQAVNIVRNRIEDQTRGVNFFPDGWELEDMILYARNHLALADTYSQSIKPGPIHNFCKIPLALAHATLDAIEAGKEKLNRASVVEIVKQVTGK